MRIEEPMEATLNEVINRGGPEKHMKSSIQLKYSSSREFPHAACAHR